MLEIRFPEDQQEGTEAVVSRWLVAAGDPVAAHEPVVEIETDKVVVEVAAPEAGRIAEICISTDGAVNAGDVLCTLETGSRTANEAQEKSEPDPSTPEADTSLQARHDRLSPAVRKQVQQHNLDIGGIDGSGKDGRITLADVEALIGARTRKAGGSNQPQAVTPGSDDTNSEMIPHTHMRKSIAKHLADSLLHTAPHVTAVFEADLSTVMQHRSANKAAYADLGTPLTLTVYFIAATVAAIRKVPQINSRWHEDQLEVFRHFNIGIATALGDEGLIVPVLQHAQDLDLEGIASKLADLTSRARAGKLDPEDVRDGTFTISNHGVSGSLLATPIIINQPQSAIIGIGKIEKRIKIREINGEDEILIRPMCYLSLTVDHRVVDAHQTNAFLTEMVNTLENWSV